MNNKPLLLSVALMSASLLAGCASSNAFLAERVQVVEYYRIFNVPAPEADRLAMINAARTGIAKSGVRVTDTRPIPPAQRPEQPGRFQVVELLKGTQFGAMAGMVGSSRLKMAECPGSVWLGYTTRAAGSEDAALYLCLWEYAGGYQLDIYGNYILKEGGISVERLAKAVVSPLLGDFEETLERLVNDVARELQTAAGVQVVYLEGHPEPKGESWWTQNRSITSPAR